MQYLVEGTGGPGFATAAEALTVLETEILPGFETLIRMEAQQKILAGGLPVGDRAFCLYHRGGEQRRGRQADPQRAALVGAAMEGDAAAELLGPRRYRTRRGGGPQGRQVLSAAAAKPRFQRAARVVHDVFGFDELPGFPLNSRR